MTATVTTASAEDPVTSRVVEAMNSQMAAVICNHAPATGDYPTAIDGLLLFRRNRPTQPDACLIAPSVVLVMQGEKVMYIADQAFGYDPRRFLVTSLDLPASSQVVDASPDKPCVGLVLNLDLRLIAELVSQVGSNALTGHGDPSQQKGVGLWLSEATPLLIEPFQRLLGLLDEQDAIGILAPMIKREIHFRLLQTEQAQRLRQIAAVDTQGYRIAKAIDWLKANFSASLKIEELAASVHMSTSTFHHHFRHFTGMSPLQYQKWLRLNEAKRLMLNGHFDASSAAYAVGYESPSQFSREYSRLYGAPPKRDIANLRSAMQSPL